MPQKSGPLVPVEPTNNRPPSRYTEQPPAAAPATCTTQYSLCDECRVHYSKIPREVDPKYLECPAGRYSVILTFDFDGTRDKAREIAEYFHARVVGIFTGCVPVHAVVRKAASGSEPAGPWLDVTSPGSEHAKAFTPNIGFLNLPGYKDLIKQGMQNEYTKAHYKRRQMSILVDLPRTISAGGDNEALVKNAIPTFVQDRPSVQHPTSTHPSAHRLKWWAETHPLTNPNEPVKKPLNPDPWARRNCQGKSCKMHSPCSRHANTKISTEFPDHNNGCSSSLTPVQRETPHDREPSSCTTTGDTSAAGSQSKRNLLCAWVAKFDQAVQQRNMQLSRKRDIDGADTLPELMQWLDINAVDVDLEICDAPAPDPDGDTQMGEGAPDDDTDPMDMSFNINMNEDDR
ncbi:hypothetical protein BJX64DRAFT_288341 [Aspergillus heterothallicus]